jgi:hypothetical protein
MKTRRAAIIAIAIVVIAIISIASAAVVLQRQLGGSIRVNSRMLEVYSDAACTQVITQLPAFSDQYADYSVSLSGGAIPTSVTFYMKNIDSGTHTLIVQAAIQDSSLPSGVTVAVSSLRSAPNPVTTPDLITGTMPLVGANSAEGIANPSATHASVTVTLNGITGATAAGSYVFTLDLNATVQ